MELNTINVILLKMENLIKKADGKIHADLIRRSIFFGSYESFKDVEEKYYDNPNMEGYKCCYCCGNAFNNNTMLYISFLENKNKVLTCEKCSKPYIK